MEELMSDDTAARALALVERVLEQTMRLADRIAEIEHRLHATSLAAGAAIAGASAANGANPEEMTEASLAAIEAAVSAGTSRLGDGQAIAAYARALDAVREGAEAVAQNVMALRPRPQDRDK
jgi:TolA-binding protein